MAQDGALVGRHCFCLEMTGILQDMFHTQWHIALVQGGRATNNQTGVLLLVGTWVVTEFVDFLIKYLSMLSGNQSQGQQHKETAHVPRLHLITIYTAFFLIPSSSLDQSASNQYHHILRQLGTQVSCREKWHSCWSEGLPGGGGVFLVACWCR